jgi:hypothetical protein
MSSNTIALITGANKGIGFETARSCLAVSNPKSNASRVLPFNGGPYPRQSQLLKDLQRPATGIFSTVGISSVASRSKVAGSLG